MTLPAFCSLPVAREAPDLSADTVPYRDASAVRRIIETDRCCSGSRSPADPNVSMTPTKPSIHTSGTTKLAEDPPGYP